MGGDQDAVVIILNLNRLPTGIFGMLAGVLDLGDVGVVVGDGCSALLELLHEDIAGRFAVVVDVRFVGHAEEEDAGSVDGFAIFV